MAIKHYKITFRDRVVIYTVGGVDNIGGSVPFRVISKGQLEILNMMLRNIAEASFSCTDEEFYVRLTPKMYENYKSLRSNEFKLIPNTT